MVTQLQAELGILNYHISTSRDKPKGFTQMSVRKHTCMHTHSTPTYLWNCRPPAEKLKHTSWGWGELWRWSGGGRGGEGCWLWRSMRLVSDIETKVKHKPSVLFCYRPISGWQIPCSFLGDLRRGRCSGFWRNTRFNLCCVAMHCFPAVPFVSHLAKTSQVDFQTCSASS